MGKMIRDRISAEVRLSGFFLLMADETKDVSKQEQLSIVVRYVDREGIINERFLTFVQAISLNAESLSTYIIQALEEHKIDPSIYDGVTRI